MEEPLSLGQKYLKVLTNLAPAGALGVSLMLGAAVPAAASTPPQGAQPSALAPGQVSERLAAVRAAVSAVGGEQATPKTGEQVAWWWRNGGWGGGWPNWHNWRNWGNWFHNW